MTTFNDPLEMISLSTLLTKSPSEIVKIFPILDKIKELKTFKIKLNDKIILNTHRKVYISLNEIIEDADFMFNHFEEFIDIYDLTADYLDINFNDYIKNISKYKVKFFKEFALLLSTLPTEIYKELVDNKKTFQEVELNLINNLL